MPIDKRRFRTLAPTRRSIGLVVAIVNGVN
jgi:hypothetical protein